MQPYEDPPPPYPGLLSDSTGSKIVQPAATATVYQPTLASSYPVSPDSGGYIPIVQPMRTATTIVATRAVPVGHNSVHCVCPYCHQNVTTEVEHESGSFAWLMCLLLTVVGCVPCCVMPFCIPSCQDINHVCPSCGNIIGRRKML